MAKEQQSDIDLGITRFEYGDTERPQRAVLTISTSKYYNGGLISNATAYWVGDHSRQNMMCLGDRSARQMQNTGVTGKRNDGAHCARLEAFRHETPNAQRSQ